MNELIVEVFSFLSVAIVWVCLAIVALKLVWNLLLPYGMLTLKQGQGVSFFPLIELVPLLLGVLISWLSGQVGIVHSATLLVYGLGAIAFTYIHFCVVALAVGLLRWKHSNRSHPVQTVGPPKRLSQKR